MTDAQDIIHEQAWQRCECGWNTTISDEPAELKRTIKWVEADHYVKTENYYTACPWCEGPVNGD